MSAVESILAGMALAGAGAILAAVLCVVFNVVLDFAARVARYRLYRRKFPTPQRGTAWRHVR